jgi:hypothetical protein
LPLGVQNSLGLVTPRASTNSVYIKWSWIWVKTILAMVLLFSVIPLLGLNEGKEKDAILYAKILRVNDPINFEFISWTSNMTSSCFIYITWHFHQYQQRDQGQL